MEVYIFKTIDKRKIPMKYAVKLCACHDMFYIVGDCEDDEIPYFIPVEWIKLNEEVNFSNFFPVHKWD